MDVLVVDDDLAMRKMLRFILTEQGGHAVTEAETPRVAEQMLAEREFDLVTLDVRMPEVDGFELCKRLRRVSNVPVLMISAHGEVESRVRGLQLGADDYLGKPFDPSELLARVTAITRRAARTAHAAQPGRMRLGRLSVDLVAHTVEVRRAPSDVRLAQLTPTEFKLLLVLATSPGKAFTHAEIQHALWGTTEEDRSCQSTVSAYISELRDRIEDDPRNPRHIVTVRGVGYRLDV